MSTFPIRLDAESQAFQPATDPIRISDAGGARHADAMERSVAPLLTLVRILARQAAREVVSPPAGDDHG